MTDTHQRRSHTRITTRLKRANGHLSAVITMINQGRPCAEIAQQLRAVEKAVTNAKRELIHDHIDHCLNLEDVEGSKEAADLKGITRYL